MHFIQCQKFTDIFGIVNELVQFVCIPIYSTIGDESHDKKPKDQRDFYMWTIGVFQSWVDCLSIRVQAFF